MSELRASMSRVCASQAVTVIDKVCSQQAGLREAMMVGVEAVEYERVLVMGTRSGFRLGATVNGEGERGSGRSGGAQMGGRTERSPVREQCSSPTANKY